MSSKRSFSIDPVLVATCAVFLSVGWWVAGLLPVGHEEISCFPNRAAQVLVETDRDGLVAEPSCASGDAVLVASGARPELSLCAGGLSLPLIVTSYASGVPYWHALASWPLHGGDAFAMRRWNLFAGLISLVLAYLLALRFTADRSIARATVVVLCVSPGFLLLHSMLFQYETTPWMLLAGAVLVATGSRRSDDEPPSGRRMAVAGGLVGLAFMTNIKALFTLTIIVLVAWRAGALRRPGRAAWVAALKAAAVGPALLLLANVLQGGASFKQQTANRLSYLLQPVSAAELMAEAINLVRFASDTASYSLGDWRPAGWAGLLAAVLFALALLHALIAGLRFLVRGGRSPLLAGCGLAVAAFFVISLKLYDQQPPANYAPLYVVFGLTLALGLGALAAALARTGLRAFSSPSRTVLVGATFCALLLGAGTVQRVRSLGALPFSFNAHAERALTDYLLANPRPELKLHTTNYNLAGVPDSLGRGELVSRRLDRPLRCYRRDEAQAACLRKKWLMILQSPGIVPTRLVLSDVDTLTDEHDGAVLQAALESAASETGHVVTREAAFTNAEGRRALLLLQVDRAP